MSYHHSQKSLELEGIDISDQESAQAQANQIPQGVLQLLGKSPQRILIRCSTVPGKTT